MKILALIPARGGSKGIPNKNIVNLLGRPLIEYTIEQSLGCKSISRTIVSTDSAEIAEIAKKAGAEIPFMRPSEFAQDHSLDIDVFYHALTFLKEKENYECDWVVHLRPTGPLRKISLIEDAIQEVLSDPSADTLRSVSAPTQTPYKMWRNVNGYLEPLLTLEGNEEPFNSPRQSLPQVLWQNGYIDIVRPEIILSRKKMCGDRIIPYVVNEPIFEIDYPEDLKLVEQEMLNKNPNKLFEPRHSV